MLSRKDSKTKITLFLYKEKLVKTLENVHTDHVQKLVSIIVENRKAKIVKSIVNN